MSVRLPKSAEVRTWREPVDAETFAACACVEVVRRGYVYGASAFLILSRPVKYQAGIDWRQLARDLLLSRLRTYGSSFRHLPMIAEINDLGVRVPLEG